MEQKQATNYDKLLLDNINTPLPIDITLSLPSIIPIL